MVFIIDGTPKSHPMNDFVKGSNLFSLTISQLQIHRMTKLSFFDFSEQTYYCIMLQ